MSVCIRSPPRGLDCGDTPLPGAKLEVVSKFVMFDRQSSLRLRRVAIGGAGSKVALVEGCCL